MTLGLDLQGGSHILLQVDRQRSDQRAAAARRATRSARCCATPRSAIPALPAAAGPCRSASATPPRSRRPRRRLQTLTASGRRPALFGAGSIQELTLDEPEPGLLKFTLTDAGINYRISDGGDAVDRGGRPARQRTRHDRADHPAPGRRPHPGPGAGPAGSAAAEGHSRPDRQADLPDGRPVDAGAGGDQRPSAGRLLDPLFARTIRRFPI